MKALYKDGTQQNIWGISCDVATVPLNQVETYINEGWVESPLDIAGGGQAEQGQQLNNSLRGSTDAAIDQMQDIADKATQSAAEANELYNEAINSIDELQTEISGLKVQAEIAAKDHEQALADQRDELSKGQDFEVGFAETFLALCEKNGVKTFGQMQPGSVLKKIGLTVPEQADTEKAQP